MKIVCIIQARTGSRRLPGKILLDLAGKPVLWRVLERVLASKLIKQVVVATTSEPNDQKIVDLARAYGEGVAVFRGSTEDVLDRYYQAAKKFGAEAVVRITADCPLIDPEIIDKVIKAFLENKDIDLAANCLDKRTYPRGLDAEVFSFKALEKSWREAKEPPQREHVTPYLRNHPEIFKAVNVINETDLSFHRWTIDEEADYQLIKIIYDRLYAKKPQFRMKDVLELFQQEPKLITINQYVEQTPDC